MITYDFSIIVPSRERYSLLMRLLESIKSKTANLSKVEVWVMYDVDDYLTCELIRDFKFFNPEVNIFWLSQYQNPYNNENYINRAARLSSSKFLWTLGNDCDIITQDWDIMLNRKIEGFLANKKDRIALISIGDDLNVLPHAPDGCCFPLITKEVLDCIDCFMPTEITRYGADIWLWKIFEKVSGRILDLRYDVGIRHYSHHTKRTKQDNVSLKMYGVNHKSWLMDAEFNSYIHKLIARINECSTS